jgi:MFS family permease
MVAGRGKCRLADIGTCQSTEKLRRRKRAAPVGATPSIRSSEVFPLETRALAIATFYAAGTAIGGVVAPLLFGILLSNHSPWPLVGGYLLASVLMIGAAAIEAIFGIDAEGRSLEEIAGPLSAG